MCTVRISYGHICVCNNSKNMKEEKVYILQGTTCTKNTVPVLIHLSFNSFQILNFAEPLTLPPGCWNVFSLKLGVKDTVTNVLSSICLATNVGVMFEIPLQIYSTVSKVPYSVVLCDYYALQTKMQQPLSQARSLSLSPERKTWYQTIL